MTDTEKVKEIELWCERYHNGDVNVLEFTFKVSKLITKLQSKFIKNKY